MRNGGQTNLMTLRSVAIAEIVDSLLLDHEHIFPCASHLQGECSLNNLFEGVPVTLSDARIEEIIEFDLSEHELSQLEGASTTRTRW